VALAAHLVLRRVGAAWQGRLPDATTTSRLRASLEIPGGAGAEASHLLSILSALHPQLDPAALTAAVAAYAMHLEAEGHLTESLLALERLFSGLPTFGAPLEAFELALLVARLNVSLARWPQAERALTHAERASGDRSELKALIRLVRASSWVGQGRIEAARVLIEALDGPLDTGNMTGWFGQASLALGAALEQQGLPLDALRAYHRALAWADPGMARREVLVALGELLRGLGAGAAARQAFTLVLAGPVPLAEQVAARIELLDLAIAQGDRVAFERQRRELVAWQDQLPPAAAVEFLSHVATGLEAFGQPGRGGRLLVEAQALAERHELHEAWFGLERRLVRNRRGAPQLKLSGAAVVPLPWEHPEIAEVAEALDRQVASLAGSV